MYSIIWLAQNIPTPRRYSFSTACFFFKQLTRSTCHVLDHLLWSAKVTSKLKMTGCWECVDDIVIFSCNIARKSNGLQSEAPFSVRRNPCLAGIFPITRLTGGGGFRVHPLQGYTNYRAVFPNANVS